MSKTKKPTLKYVRPTVAERNELQKEIRTLKSRNNRLEDEVKLLALELGGAVWLGLSL